MTWHIYRGSNMALLVRYEASIDVHGQRAQTQITAANEVSSPTYPRHSVDNIQLHVMWSSKGLCHVHGGYDCNRRLLCV
jgi:hypothetical protein